MIGDDAPHDSPHSAGLQLPIHYLFVLRGVGREAGKREGGEHFPEENMMMRGREVIPSPPLWSIDENHAIRWSELCFQSSAQPVLPLLLPAFCAHPSAAAFFAEPTFCFLWWMWSGLLLYNSAPSTLPVVGLVRQWMSCQLCCRKVGK